MITKLKLSNVKKLTEMKGFKIVHMNCCSIVNKMDQIRSFIAYESQIDILCLTETWLKPYHDSCFFQIDGYTLYRFDRERKHKDLSYVQGG